MKLLLLGLIILFLLTGTVRSWVPKLVASSLSSPQRRTASELVGPSLTLTGARRFPISKGHDNDESEWKDGHCDAHDGSWQPMLIVQRHNPSGRIPEGWRLANHAEAFTRQQQLVESFEDWEICKLDDKWKIDGPGYGGRIMKQSPGDAMSCQIIIPAGSFSDPAS